MARELGRRLKVGHGGTLDPIATGVLVIGVGEGCKRLTGFLGGVTKKYRATGRLGRAYDTYDRTGVVVRERSWEGERVTAEAITQVLRDRFTGPIQQRPPLFSAIHINGERAYEVARKRQKEQLARGSTVPEKRSKPTGKGEDPEDAVGGERDGQQASGDGERRVAGSDDSVPTTATEDSMQLAERPVTIHHIKLLSCTPPEFVLEMECSSGTYVRSLIHDLGEALGTAAAMWELERTAQGSVGLEDCLAIEDLGSVETIRSHLK